MHMSDMSEHPTINKRHSPFFVKDILGLSDESETESDMAMDSDDQNRESSTEESMENCKYLIVQLSKNNSNISTKIDSVNCAKFGFSIYY